LERRDSDLPSCDESMMKAVAIPRFGGPEVLSLVDSPVPEPGPGQVTIDVTHAGVNFAEVLYRRGGVDVPLPFIPGIEVAGHIRAVGRGVQELSPGQPVAALTIVDGGGYAEVVSTDARLVAPLPGEPGQDELALASGISSNTTTAFMVLRDVAQMQAREAVLVHAAAGGVGSQLGQVARLLGASKVTGVIGSEAKRAAAEGFGYDEVILSEELDERIAKRRFDVIVDMVGGSVRQRSLQALALGGRLVAMGNASDAQDVRISTNELWLSGTGVLGFNLAAISAARASRVGSALRIAVEAVLSGDLRLEISARMPLERAGAAHEMLESRASTGKIVLDVQARG
jgi:NADPH2:quinone reductase